MEIDGLIHVLGGEDGASELLTMEVYDPHTRTWSARAGMTMVRKVSSMGQTAAGANQAGIVLDE